MYKGIWLNDAGGAFLLKNSAKKTFDAAKYGGRHPWIGGVFLL